MGLIRGIARTAAVAGTATVVSNRVSRRQANRWAEKDQQQADAAADEEQQAAPQQQAYAPPPPRHRLRHLRNPTCLASFSSLGSSKRPVC